MCRATLVGGPLSFDSGSEPTFAVRNQSWSTGESRPHRGQHVHDRRQQLVLDVDQLHRFFGDVDGSAATAATAWPLYSTLS